MNFKLQNGRANFDKVGKVRRLPPSPAGTGPIPVEGITKYYTFNGQRVAVRKNHLIGGDSFAYLHTDHPSAALRAGSGQCDGGDPTKRVM